MVEIFTPRYDKKGSHIFRKTSSFLYSLHVRKSKATYSSTTFCHGTLEGTLSIIQFKRIHFLAQKPRIWWSFLLNLSAMDKSDIPSSRCRGLLFLFMSKILFISCPMTYQNCCTFLQCHKQCVRLPISTLHFGHSGNELGLNLWRWEGEIWTLCRSFSCMALTRLHTLSFFAFFHTSFQSSSVILTLSSVSHKPFRE